MEKSSSRSEVKLHKSSELPDGWMKDIKKKMRESAEGSVKLHKSSKSPTTKREIVEEGTCNRPQAMAAAGRNKGC